jgi:rhamnosyltransferase
MPEPAAVVVTYFPDADAVRTLKRLSELCETLIIIDNTPEELREPFPQSSNVVLWNSEENIGLASALNRGMHLAAGRGIEEVFLFDQDSRPSDRYFQQMLEFKSRLMKSGRKIAFCVPNFYDRNSKTFAMYPVVGRFSIRHVTCRNMSETFDNAALMAITSGMLITQAAYRAVGPFREDYFIDFIDNEYCLRAHADGYSVAVNCNAILDHAVGRRSVKRLLGLTIKPNHHPPNRKYYIFRNGVRTTMDYFRQYPAYAGLMAARLIHEALSIALYEKDKYKKMRAMAFAIYHASLNRMGQCPF